MKFNAQTILNQQEVLDIHFEDVSYSPLFSNIGLAAPEDYSGIETLVLHYNRKSRNIWNAFLQLEDGLVRKPSSMDQLYFENGDKKAVLAFYDRDMFVIETENTDTFQLCGEIADTCKGVWVESKTADSIVIRGYSLNGDGRDPDLTVPFRAGIRAVRGSLCEEENGNVTVHADAAHKTLIAFVFEALDTTEESIAEKLTTAPMAAMPAVQSTRKWLVDMLYDFETEVASEREAEILTHALKGLLYNATIAPGNLDGHISVYPSRGHYPTHYLWDSCFQNLALEYLSPRLAKDSLLMYHQCQRVDGKFPQFLCSTWNRPHEAQPALIGWATLRVVEKEQEPDMDFVEKMFSALEKNNQWWLNQRMTRHGVMYCPHGLETGQDNSPRFDEGPILALDMNSYLLSQMRATVKLAKLLGNDAAAEKWTKKADTLSENMVKVLYDPKQNMFFDAYPDTGKHRPLWSASAFLPLWAGVDIGQDRAMDMIRTHMLNEKKFYGEIPFPCVAYDQDVYQAEEWWRGPTWMSLSWLMIETLEKYGFHAEREHVCKVYYDMILKDGNLRELFNSKTGEGLGAYDQGWTAAVFVKLNKVLHGK